jgi:hypothetical protein
MAFNIAVRRLQDHTITQIHKKQRKFIPGIWWMMMILDGWCEQIFSPYRLGIDA